MATSFGYVLQSASVVGTPSLSRPYAAPFSPPYLGFGLLTPFRRDQKADFAAGGGAALVKSCVGQVLGMDASDDAGNAGELPWRPELGSWLYKLTFANVDDEVTEHIAKVYVAEALQRWEPRVVLKSATLSRKKTVEANDTLVLHLVYDLVSSNAPGNQVLLRNVAQSLEIAA